jgi:hypothetical protein
MNYLISDNPFGKPGLNTICSVTNSPPANFAEWKGVKLGIIVCSSDVQLKYFP